MRTVIAAVLVAAVLIALSLTGASSDATPIPSITGTPQIGNGYWAMMLNASSLFVGGVFSGETIKSQRAGIPPQHLAIAGAVSIPNAKTSLPFGHDFEQAVAFEELDLSSIANGLSAWIRYYAHRSHRHIFARDIFFQCSFMCMANVRNKNITTVDVTLVPTWASLDSAHTELVSKKDNAQLYRTKIAEWPGHSQRTSVAQCQAPVPKTVTLDLSQWTPATTHVVSLPMALVTSIEGDTVVGPDLQATCAALLAKYTAVPTKVAFAQHTAAWAKLWESQIVYESASNKTRVPGDTGDLPIVVQATQYALLSALRADWPFSTSPGGLATGYYDGSTFWDISAVWAGHWVGVMHPDIYRENLIEYRLRRGAGALDNARNWLHIKEKGAAAFPWQSAFSGVEVNPWPRGSYEEIHITADVAFTWMNYVWLQSEIGGLKFLKTIWPLLAATADFWCAKATWAADGSVHIDNVTPPDEYHGPVDDSVYTNNAARAHVQFAIDVATLIEPSTFSRLKRWKAFVKNIVILYDAEFDRHPEYKNYNGSTIKQADVVLTNYPWRMPMPTNRTAKNDLEYYAARTSAGGPAMTWSLVGVGWAGEGVFDKALSNFFRGYQTYCLPPLWQWHEVSGGGGCPNFLTGAGGFLHSLYAGLGGLRVEPTATLRVLTSKIMVPNDDTMTVQSLRYQGAALTFEYQGSRVLTITLKTPTPVPGAQIVVDGIVLKVGGAPYIKKVTRDAADVVIEIKK